MKPLRPPTEAFFLAAPDGQRLCLYHRPAESTLRGAVVYVHPLAEEMNKSRRMAALQSRALADAGFAVLQIDLHGCGDSSGDFGEATWAGWVDDVVNAARWLQTRHKAELWLWGLRAGCLLAVQAAQQVSPCNFLFWQPATSGKQHLQQFLRLKVAAELFDSGAKGTTEGLRSDLASGVEVYIAGYRLAPVLAAGFERASLREPAHLSRIVWLELSTREDAALLPASLARIEAWRAAGHRVDADVVQGPSFWQTQEIEDAPDLIIATLAGINTRVNA